MKHYTSLIFGLLLSTLSAQNTSQWPVRETRAFTLHATPGDTAILSSIGQYLETGVDEIEQFFQKPFPAHFNIWLFPNRAALDRQWQSDWGDSTFQSQCWMVASGIGKRLDVLSPRAWDSEACEHQASDTTALYQLLKHELIHVFHGQHCPIQDFTGMDPMGWWIEGLATFAAGQLNPARMTRVRALVQAGKAPDHMESCWSGKERYGLAGSVVASMEHQYGRERLLQLMSATTNEALFKLLEADEKTLLTGWRDWLSHQN